MNSFKRVVLELKQKILRRLTRNFRKAEMVEYRRFQNERFMAREYANRPW